MEFLKKHYEKLILLLLLVIFILMMVHMMGIVARTREVTDKDLAIPQRAPDHVMADPGKDEFNSSRYLEKSRLQWLASEPRDRDKNLNHFSDLVTGLPLARCPHCSKIVPFYYFSGKTCPECHQELLTPPERPRVRERRPSPEDLDGDGIPNSVEQRYQLDQENPEDANFDLDGDGFSNIYEYEHNTDMANPLSHPPLWHRLRLRGFEKAELDVTFMSLNIQNTDDQTMWDIQLNRKTGKKDRQGKDITRSQMTRLDGEVEVDRRRYKIVKIERIQNERTKSDGSGKEIVDESKIYLEEVVRPDESGVTLEPDRLEMQVGRKTYSSDRRPVLIDDGVPGGQQLEAVRKGEVFSIGNLRMRNIPVTRYMVHSFDEKKQTVTLANPRPRGDVDPTLDREGKVMLVTSEGGIPETDRVVENPYGSGNMPGGMPML